MATNNLELAKFKDSGIMKNEESLLILQTFTGFAALILGSMLVAASFLLDEQNRKLIHPILGEITLRSAFLIAGCLMMFLGGLVTL